MVPVARACLASLVGAFLTLLYGMEFAFAHGTERGLVMLLPTGYYQLGGAFAVAASFVVLAFVPQVWLGRIENRSIKLFEIPGISPFWPSICSFGLLCLLLLTGFFGSTDPLANPLPLFIWTLWWVGLIMMQCVSGNLWTHINPWSGPVWLIRKVLNLDKAPFTLPEKLGYWPAFLVFFGFAWLELVYPAPEDPPRLAFLMLTYWCFVTACITLFGEKVWFARAEPFAIFFRLIGVCSPLAREHGGINDPAVVIRLTWPGANFLKAPALPMSGVLFVLLTLSTVSFDGFSKSFTWLSFINVNPLEYPGRSAVIVENTWGLICAFVVLAGLFLSSVLLGCALLRRLDSFTHACGRFIYSIIPISLVFHIAHYLTLILVNGQYAVFSLNDPFGNGWNLLGMKHGHVTTSFLTNLDYVSTIWITQTVVIVLGHLMGIVIAHILAIQIFGSVQTATKSQSFLAILMVAYTVFGLWILSTAAIG